MWVHHAPFAAVDPFANACGAEISSMSCRFLAVVAVMNVIYGEIMVGAVIFIGCKLKTLSCVMKLIILFYFFKCSFLHWVGSYMADQRENLAVLRH